MKLNKILMALAATAIVGCTSDDLNDFSAKQAPEDSRMIELNSDFAIAGVGVEGAMTRTHWEADPTLGLVNKFLPIWKTAPAGGNKIYDVTTGKDADLTAQAVGLCWLGQGTVGTDVYTNYQFYHFGWLNNDETKAEVECNQLMNGSLYSDITVATGDAAGAEADPTKFTLPTKSATAGLNYNSGVYKTDNKAIFGGKYIVYYPFNENFKEAGTIPAIAETEFNPASTEFTTKELGHATFRYSAPVTIEGGDQAADFGMYNLSALVQLKVFSPEGDGAIGRKVDQIVLYSPSEKLLKQANLAADKIVAGAKGAELYAETEGTKTISAKFKAADVVELKKKAEAAKGAFITVLPTTVEDLKVLVHSTDALGTDGKWATIDKANTEFKAGSAKVLELSVTAADLKADYIAVDDASLQTALTEARAAASATAPQTITVIGDITLATSPCTINDAKDANITIKGDDIIVPQDIALYINTNMESDVRVLGKSCCTGTNGGRLFVEGGTINNVTMEPTGVKKELTPTEYDKYNPYVTYTGAATVAAGTTDDPVTFDVQAGTVEVQKAVEHKGNINIKEDAKLVVIANGDLNFMGSTVVNDGTIEVLKNGKFDMTDANGNATADDGKRMTNNGKFIHNVDAGVGTAVQSMNQKGEYRCRVDNQDKLSDAYQQWTACSVIEMVNPTPAAAVTYNLGAAKPNINYLHNGKPIDIEVNTPGLTTIFDNTVNSSKGDTENIQIGNLTVTAGGLNVNFKGTADPKNLRTLTVNGNMLVKAATNLTASQKIDIKKVDGTGGNLTVDGATLTYAGAKANKDGLAVAGDITVSAGTLDAYEDNALNITSANFYLTKAGKAKIGNRTDGADKNLVVAGTISNPEGCTFDIKAATSTTLLAWVTCTKLEVGGTFSAARPRVVAAE